MLIGTKTLETNKQVPNFHRLPIFWHGWLKTHHNRGLHFAKENLATWLKTNICVVELGWEEI